MYPLQILHDIKISENDTDGYRYRKIWCEQNSRLDKVSFDYRLLYWIVLF